MVITILFSLTCPLKVSLNTFNILIKGSPPNIEPNLLALIEHSRKKYGLNKIENYQF